MSKTLMIGSNGKVGRLLLPMMRSSGLKAVAMVRVKNQVTASSDVDVVEADLEQDFAYAFDGCDRVIFTAGSGASSGLEKTLLVDLWAARRAIDYAVETNVRHFIMISSRGADNPDKGPLAIKPYLVAKCFADEYLMQSGMPYTILRPGRLTDDDNHGLISTVRPDDADKQVVSRVDTAKVVMQVLNNPLCINNIYELYKGDNTINAVIT
jgi:uncharacterized protein YbjT (DUF2867 family)